MNRYASGIAALLLLTGFSTGCKSEKPYEKPPTPVRVQTVGTKAQDDAARFSAVINPKVQVDLSFRISGYVGELLQVTGPEGHPRPVQEGDSVSKGTMLARLQEVDYRARQNHMKAQLDEAEAAFEQARSQVAEADAVLERARTDFERASRLFAAKSIIKPDYDAAKLAMEANSARANTAKAQMDATEARVKGARATLQEAQTALEDTTLRAPMDGMVLKRNVEVGTLASPGSVAFVVGDVSSMKVCFGVPDVTVKTLELGAPLPVVVGATAGAEFQGLITRISPAADPASRSFEVEISIPNPDNRLRAGMIASVKMAPQDFKRNMPVAPLGAIVRPKGSPSAYGVFVLEEHDGKQSARLRPVKLGEVIGNNIAVEEGLQAGEKIIVSGAQFLTDGELVRVIP